MHSAGNDEVTELLRAWSAGDPAAGEQVVRLVYDELRRQAARYLRRERRDHTLRPTALVHEAYVRLIGQPGVSWQNRSQFFAVAAQMMRRVLVDHARARARAKREGGWYRISLEEVAGGRAPGGAVGGAGVHASGGRAGGPPDVDLLALDLALTELAAVAPDRARLVELRFFAGLSIEETAQVLGVSVSTVTRDWRMAKAWLYRRIQGQGAPGR